MEAGNQAVRRLDFRTRDPDEAQRFLAGVLPHRRLRHSGNPDAFVFAVRSARADGLSAHVANYSTSAECEVEAVHDLVALRVVTGRLSISVDGQHTELGKGDLAVVPLGSRLDVGWSDLELEALTLPWPSIADAARTVGDIGLEELRLLGTTPVSEAMARHWHHTMRFLHQELFARRSAFGVELLRSAFAQTAAVTALLTFPNTALDRDHLLRGAGTAPPAALRRAVAFMTANARRPITVVDIAAEAGVSVRSLEQTFRRWYGRTPTAHLRAVRLSGAHRELRAADPSSGVTVAQTAARWGYGHSAFSSAYRRRFGVSPRDTLAE